MREWRLIRDGRRPGSFNMAADSVLLEACTPETPPTLRLYRWTRPILSLGRNEPLDDLLDSPALQALGIPVIRRVTGGKAVLHGGDLTYSVTGAVLHPQFAGGVLDNYRFLAQGFKQFFQNLGLAPEIQSERASDSGEPHICFSDPSAYEILVQGRKLIGNAQRVRSVRTSQGPQRVFLQHGSIPVEDPVPLMLQIFPHAQEETLRREMHSLETCAGLSRCSPDELEALLLEALSAALQVSWRQQSWSPEELQAIQEKSREFPSISGTLLACQESSVREA